MKTNYSDFISDYNELKIRAIELSEILSKFSRKFINFKEFKFDEIYSEFDEELKTQIPLINLTYEEPSSCGCCGGSNLYFSAPIEVLFSEQNMKNYVEEQKDKIYKENEKVRLQKEQELKKEEERKIKRDLEKIESEKKLLIELSNKYPEILNEKEKEK